MLRIETVYQTKNPAYTRQRAADHIGILVHTTDSNNKYIKRYVDAPELLGVNRYGNHWNKPTATKCMHAFVGLDKNGEIMVANTLPYEYACSGCGKGARGSYNYNPTAHIQFEICEGSDSDADYYWKAIAAAEEYCAYLCRLFGWTAENITSHVEAAKKGYASDHADPEEYMRVFGDNMDRFRARVAALLKDEQEETAMMKYIVTGNRLALREKPSTSSKVLQRMDTGTEIMGEPATADWVKITYNGKTGYSMVKYLRAIEPVEKAPADNEPEHELTDKEKLDVLWEWYQRTEGKA